MGSLVQIQPDPPSFESMEAVGWIVAVPPPRYVSKRGHLGELGFSESEQAQLSASERQNQGDSGWLFE